jgi:geranylgeranyl pyrophosphate synthase
MLSQALIMANKDQWAQTINGSLITHIVLDNLVLTLETKMFELLQSTEKTSFIETSVLSAARYHLRSGGSRVRARLALHAGLSIGLAPNDAITIATTVELLHNASLIHDDLQDRDTLRRNVKTVWAEYGDNIAICAGDLLISSAYCALSSFSNPSYLPALIRAVHANTSTAIHGQCLDLCIDGGSVKDIEVYAKIAAAKSGALLSLPFELAFLGAGKSQWIVEAKGAAEAFAIGYQIIDDLTDLDCDKSNGETPARLNSVLVIAASGHEGVAIEEAKRLARYYLSEAEVRSNKLPNGCGLLLAELTHKLLKSQPLLSAELENIIEKCEPRHTTKVQQGRNVKKNLVSSVKGSVSTGLLS